MNFAIPDASVTSGLSSEFASDAAHGHHATLQIRVSKLETGMEYIRDDIHNLRLELRDTRTELRAEIGDLRTELRTEIREVRTDFRFLTGSFITVSLGLAGMMAKGFHWI
jgi:chromosome segregation ATPase